MITKYLPALAAGAVLLAACQGSAGPGLAVPTAAPSPTPAAAAPPSPSPGGLPGPPHARLGPLRRWHTVPDAAFAEPLVVTVTFPDADVAAGRPRVRLRGNGRAVPLAATGPTTASWGAEVPLDGLAVGEQAFEVLIRLASGADAVVASGTFLLSHPEYVVWTLDFEGLAASDETLANTAAIADALGIRTVVLWNPRVWTASAVSAARAAAMLAWTKARAAKGDEVGLHLHLWTDFVRAAGVRPRTEPSWAGRDDGYDTPLYAYDEAETRALLDFSLRLYAERGLPRPTSFRAASYMVMAHNLRAIAAAGFTADCSAAPAGGIGRLRYPWTLPEGAQPYRPSPTDQHAPGDLPLLLAPTIGGNTFGHGAESIRPQVRANLALLAPPGEVARERRAITLVSHPETVGAAEREAIEALLGAFGPLRYDADSGPLRFVTLRQLAAAYAR